MLDDIVTDTHAVIWGLSNRQRLSPDALAAMNNAENNGIIYVPSICLVEITYLVEKKRIPSDLPKLLRDALDDPTTAFQLVGLSRSVADSLVTILRDEIPDMPDRIIAATALTLNLPLVTRDGKIQASNIQTIW